MSPGREKSDYEVERLAANGKKTFMVYSILFNVYLHTIVGHKCTYVAFFS